MNHLFGDLVSQYLHRKHGLRHAGLAASILQDPSIMGRMCKGRRLLGPQARVCAGDHRLAAPTGNPPRG
ncbi:MAG: hypothetical protein R2932_34045 [Caldilineaceae bacterium]